MNQTLIKTGKKGHLILIGGAEDRKDDKIILKKIVELNNAKTVTVVPSASCYPTGVSEDYYHAFKSLGVENIQIFDIREPAEADQDKYIKDIEKSDLVFFTGGDQVKLFHVFRNSELLDKIKDLHFNHELNIAGTSAGAAVASNPMIYDGNIHGMKKGSVHFSEGFGLLKDITIDTHFISRGRLGRLTQFLCTGITSYGIGLGENTAIFINPENIFESEILFPSRINQEIDWDTVNRLASENADFNDFLKLITEDCKLGKVKSQYDKVLKMEELTKYIKDKGINNAHNRVYGPASNR